MTPVDVVSWVVGPKECTQLLAKGEKFAIFGRNEDNFLTWAGWLQETVAHMEDLSSTIEAYETEARLYNEKLDLPQAETENE